MVVDAHKEIGDRRMKGNHSGNPCIHRQEQGRSRCLESNFVIPDVEMRLMRLGSAVDREGRPDRLPHGIKDFGTGPGHLQMKCVGSPPRAISTPLRSRAGPIRT